jgi:uncharacterized membrane protein (Fun14 family)
MRTKIEVFAVFVLYLLGILCGVLGALHLSFVPLDYYGVMHLSCNRWLFLFPSAASFGMMLALKECILIIQESGSYQ